MAKFTGTLQEFHHFIGPRIRNTVNLAAKRHRVLCRGICQECHCKAELHSAHIHGRGRRMIIEEVLAECLAEDQIVSCDLDEVERRILDAHGPIDAAFRFLCPGCHVKYDATLRQESRRGKEGSGKVVESGFQKIGRVRLWANRPGQAPSMFIRAFLELEKENRGRIRLADLKNCCTSRFGITGFSGKYASLKTDAGNSYGKVFRDEGDVVEMYPEVREEVVRWFAT